MVSSGRFGTTCAMIALLTAVSLCHRASPSSQLTADLVVVGATPSGIVAAVAAKRTNASLAVLVVEPWQHTAGIIGAGMLDDSNMGRTEAYGGLATEFYAEVYRYLHNLSAPDGHYCFRAAPHTVDAAMRAWLARSGVRLITGACLTSATTAAGRITAARFESCGQPSTSAGTPTATASPFTVAAPVFVDASYEGDLAAMAGVPMAHGREGREAWNESLAGAGLCSSRGYYETFKVPVSPWEGAVGGRLLPFVALPTPPPPGAADGKIQSFNFRACLTRDAAHGVAIPPPRAYNATQFLLLERYVRALHGRVSLTTFFGCTAFGAAPGAGACDTNDGAAFGINPLSTETWGWPLAAPSDRAALRDVFVQYTLSLWHFVRTSPAVPAAVQEDMAALFLCAAEWPDLDHLPPTPYVREGRRLNGSAVFTQEDWRHAYGAPLPAGRSGMGGGRPALNASVGLGFWFLDCHAVQRVAVGNTTHNEGCVQVGRDLMDKGATFGLPYGLIVPPEGSIANLLVTNAVSASHIGYQAIRVEPSLMVLGHAAGAAAALLLGPASGRSNGTTWGIDITALRATLLAQQAILDRQHTRPAPLDNTC